MAATQASIPTHAGGLSLSRNWASSRSRPLGAYGSSIPSGLSTRRLVAASPQITSACGFAFSARSFAVTTPVESRTHLISMSGLSSLKRAAYFLRSSASIAVYTVSVVFPTAAPGRSAIAVSRATAASSTECGRGRVVSVIASSLGGGSEPGPAWRKHSAARRAAQAGKAPQSRRDPPGPLPRLLRGEAAVDRQLGPGHEGRFVRGEEEGGEGDLPGVGDPAEGDAAPELTPQLLGQVRRLERRVHDPGVDDVAADPVLAELDRQRLGQGDQGALRGGVGVLGSGEADQGGDGAHVDDGAAAGLLQVRDAVLGDPEDRLEVDGHDAVPLAGVGLEHRAVAVLPEDPPPVVKGLERPQTPDSLP